MGMLILTRRPGEKIMIGKDITIVVAGVCGNQVRVAIEAPRDVAIHREEVKARIDREVAQAQAHRSEPRA